jgi:hypothetical protein
MRRILACLLFAGGLWGQTYELILTGGHVIDPANGIDEVMDVAVANGRIAAIGKQLSRGARIFDASGHYVTPGLVDMHVHVYLNARSATVAADQSVLPHGTTTIVDAGCSGWRTFDDFKATVIDRSKVRIPLIDRIVHAEARGELGVGARRALIGCPVCLLQHFFEPARPNFSSPGALIQVTIVTPRAYAEPRCSARPPAAL